MNKDFQKHKKLDTVKWIAAFLAIIILAVSVSAALTKGFTDANPYGWLDKKAEDKPVEDTDKPAEETPVETEAAISQMFLSMGEASAASENGYTKSISITATVLPVEAPNKAVDWYVAWGVAPTHGTENVQDYVTVNPVSDGSLTATVTCSKAFGDDNIILTCVSRVGGFRATCNIIYVGTPTMLSIDISGVSMDIVDEIDDEIVYKLLLGESANKYEFPLDLDNEFGLVGSSFTPNYTVSVAGIGGKIKFQRYDPDDGELVYSYKSLSDIIGNTGSPVIADMLIDYSIQQGTKLRIVPKAVLSNLSYTQNGLIYSFNSYQNSNGAIVNPYLAVTVTETNTGLRSTFYFQVLSPVSSVSLSQSTISF